MINLLPSLHTVFAFFIALGVLVVIHEMGHYLVARACGVTVLRFSFGFGKILFSRKFGKSNTEWAISLFPLGGYVKMLDAREQDISLLSEADLKGEFCRQSVWKRIAIILAGPLANFILAIVLFTGMHLYGMPELGTAIRVVNTDSLAYLSGLRNGDQIVSVNQQEVQTWKDLRWQLLQLGLNHTPVELQVRRAPVDVQPSSVANAATDVKLEKIQLSMQSLSASDFESDFMAKLDLSPSAPPTIIDSVLAGGAADRAGLKVKDRIIALNEHTIIDARDFTERIRKSANQELELSVLRDAATLKLKVVPSKVRDGQQVFGQVGIAFASNYIVLKVSPLDAFYKSVQNTWDVSILDFKMMWKMVKGELSFKNLTGPITIAEYAGKSLRIGIMSFLSLIAFISISLGVMNLLPIPMLDGGHLLYYSLEVFSGKPVSEKFSEYAQRVGFAILMLLMMTAFYNDILRQMSKAN